jgi:hypothetical protein
MFRTAGIGGEIVGARLHRRAGAVALGFAVAWGVAAAGCRPDHHRPPGSPGTAPSSSTTTVAGTPRRDCGAVLRGGAPTTAYNGTAVRCFSEAWETGTPATVRLSGREGESLEVVAVHVLVRRTAAGVHEVCTSLSVGVNDLNPRDCSPAAPD